ncbi:MAG: hypothetical protein ACLP5V_13785 [Candidatus Bathyarchaeia archaeon]
MKEPYADVCRFMLVGGLGWHEFKEINESEQLQAEITKQAKNDKPYVRLDLTPRKNNVDFWPVLLLKKFIPSLPAKTHDWYKDRGGKQITQSDLGFSWRKAAQEFELWERDSGPDLLRSVFKSTCRKIGVAEPAIEGQLGHTDAMNYGREWQDEAYVAKELSKFWHFLETGVSTAIHEELKALQEENRQQREENRRLREELEKRPTLEQMRHVLKDLAKEK